MGLQRRDARVDGYTVKGEIGEAQKVGRRVKP